MKKYISYILVVLFTLASSNLVEAGSKNTVKFVTLGNCSVCKARIEGAVNTLPGIDSVLWDSKGKVTNVTYDATLTDVYTIMKKIAEVGDDNEWYQATDFVYNNLESCCKYSRTIDYSNIKIGYLSLMGLWMGVNDTKGIANSISVEPNIITNGELNLIVNYDFPDNFNIDIFSLDGVQVISRNITGTADSRLDISTLAKGYYIIIISDKKGILTNSKFLIL
jgi:copper chaperone CopZ